MSVASRIAFVAMFFPLVAGDDVAHGATSPARGHGGTLLRSKPRVKATEWKAPMRVREYHDVHKAERTHKCLQRSPIVFAGLTIDIAQRDDNIKEDQADSECNLHRTQVDARSEAKGPPTDSDMVE